LLTALRLQNPRLEVCKKQTREEVVVGIHDAATETVVVVVMVSHHKKAGAAVAVVEKGSKVDRQGVEAILVSSGLPIPLDHSYGPRLSGSPMR